jgi:hypothetical protein
MLYPIDHLPDLGFPALDDEVVMYHATDRARRLTAAEKALIQCAYIWMQTLAPQPPAVGGYTELWYMLQHFELLRQRPREDHRARYDAAMCYKLPHSYDDVTGCEHFAVIGGILQKCALLQQEMTRIRHLMQPKALKKKDLF